MSLQTYTGSSLNIISQTLQTYLDERRLKPGEIVKYRLLNGVKNIDPQREKGNDMLFPSSVTLKLKHSVLDPGDEGKNNSKIADVAVVRSFDETTKRPVFSKFAVHPQKGDGGIFMIRGNNVAEMEMYDVFELSNENGSNPYRDQSEAPLFERVNEAAEGRARSNKRNYLFDSLNAIRNWDYSKMRIMAAGYNLSTQLPMDVLRDELESIAEKSPEAFYKAIDGQDLEIKAIIKMAKDAGIISFIAHENKWVFTASDDLIITLDRKEGVTENDQFALFLKNSANGDKIKGNLERMLAAKKKKIEEPKKTV